VGAPGSRVRDRRRAIPGRSKGPSGLTEGWRGFLSAWEDFRGEPEEFYELDDERVAVLARVSGRGKTSGLEVSHTGAKVLGLSHLRGGKVTRCVFYLNGEQALADLAAGSQTDSSPS
jgi:hypothetical protein